MFLLNQGDISRTRLKREVMLDGVEVGTTGMVCCAVVGISDNWLASCLQGKPRS